MTLQRFLASLTAAITVAVSTASTSSAVPLVGGGGLCPNASALAAYIQETYPNVRSIGGIRQDPLPDHPSGHALDIMVGGNTSLGNTIRADLAAQSGRFGVRYMLWQVANHYDHIHVTVN